MRRRRRRLAGSPYAIVPERAVGTGLEQLHDQLCQRQADGQPGGADDHGEQHEQDVRPDGDVRRHGVHESGLVNGDTVTSVTLTSTGAAATATVAGSPYAIVPSAAVGTGLSNYTISYVNGSLTVTRRR